MNLLRKSLLPVSAVLMCMVPVALPKSAVAAVYGPTLTTPATPTRVTGADGFIPRWSLLEPIPVNGLTEPEVQAMVKKQWFPDEYTVIPKDGQTEQVGDATKTWHAVDTRLYNVNLYHFAYSLKKPTSNVLFWAVTIVNAPEEMHDVRLAIGSNAASVWWVNGEEVVGIYNDRQTTIDDGVSKRITLKKGANVVRAAVVNAGGATDFCARFLDANGKPIKGLTITLSEPK
jgi:hypothetical protein